MLCEDSIVMNKKYEKVGRGLGMEAGYNGILNGAEQEEYIRSLEKEIKDCKAIIASREHEIAEQNKYIQQLEQEREQRGANDSGRGFFTRLKELMCRYMEKGMRFLRRVKHNLMK